MKDKLKITLIAGIIAALSTLAITFVTAGTNGRTGAKEGETVLQVSRLSCGACLKSIEDELRKHKGMLGMTADLASGLVTVRHTAELAPERLAELVTATGYPAKVVPQPTAAGPAAATSTPGCRGCGPKGCNLPASGPGKI